MKKLLFFLILFSPLFTAAQVIVTCAGDGTAGFTGDHGPAIDAELYHPYGVALDDSGNLYICDGSNMRIRKVSPGYGGIITTIAGNGMGGYGGDGGLGIYAQVSGIDVAVDKHGNVYIADVGNSCIRKVTPLDTITTVAGIGVAGYNGDNIPATAAQLNSPTGVIVDNLGDIYIADAENYRIRMVDTAGIIHTLAGIGIAGFSPDGSMADTAQLGNLWGIRIDNAGDIFYTDSSRVRKINGAGIVSTVAGNGIEGFSGDDGMATAAEIGGGGQAIDIDADGNLYIADAGNNRIREVNVAGIIYTIVDSDGYYGFSGDGGPPLLAKLDGPAGIVVDDSGDIYIGDVSNNRVRFITKHPLGINNNASIEQGIHVFPNPSDGVFTLIISSYINEQTKVSIINILGEKVQEFTATTNQKDEVELNVPPGIYFLSATIATREYNEKIIIQ